MDENRYRKIKDSSTFDRIFFLIKDASLYGGSMALTRLLSLITFPILTRIFSKADYGIIDAISILSAAFPVFIIMGQDSAIARFFFESDSYVERKQIVSQGLLCELIVMIFVCPLLYINSNFIMIYYLGSDEYTYAFKVVILTIPFTVLFQFCQNLLKWTFNRNLFILISIGSSIMTVAATILFVVVLKMGILGTFYAYLLVQVIFSFLGLVFCREYLALPSNIQYLPQMLNYGWPYMLVGVATSFVPSIDRYFITNHLTFEVMGVYAVAFKYVMLLRLPIYGFQTAWGPFAFSIYKQTDAEKTYQKVLLFYVIMLSLAGFLLCITAESAIVFLASSKYSSSYTLVLPLTFALIIDSISWITGLGIGLSKKTHYSIFSYCIGIISTIIGIYIGMMFYGIIGVAYGVLFGRIGLTCATTLFSQRLYYIKYGLFRSSIFMMATFVLCLLIQKMSILKWYFQTGLTLASITLLIVILWYFLFSQEDKEKVGQLVRNILIPRVS